MDRQVSPPTASLNTTHKPTRKPYSETSATFNGTADPNGSSTVAWFELGTNTAYGFDAPTVSVGSGTSPQGHSRPINGLSWGGTYHFRAAAQNAGGTDYGSDRSFNPSACAVETCNVNVVSDLTEFASATIKIFMVRLSFASVV